MPQAIISENSTAKSAPAEEGGSRSVAKKRAIALSIMFTLFSMYIFIVTAPSVSKIMNQAIKRSACLSKEWSEHECGR